MTKKQLISAFEHLDKRLYFRWPHLFTWREIWPSLSGGKGKDVVEIPDQITQEWWDSVPWNKHLSRKYVRGVHRGIYNFRLQPEYVKEEYVIGVSFLVGRLQGEWIRWWVDDPKGSDKPTWKELVALASDH